MQDMHVVLRPFDGAGASRRIGEVVDASAWRLSRQLVENRYLKPLPAGVEPVPCTCGRLWVDAELAARHDCGEGDPLAGVKFSSPASEQLAREEGLTAGDLQGVEASGVKGYTKSDLEAVLERREAA